MASYPYTLLTSITVRISVISETLYIVLLPIAYVHMMCVRARVCARVRVFRPCMYAI